MTYEQTINILEKALDKACKYTHNNGLNGCPANFDIGAVDKKKKKECILCKFHCGSEKYFFNKEYEKKSKECWKEYFLKGERTGKNDKGTKKKAKRKFEKDEKNDTNQKRN